MGFASFSGFLALAINKSTNRMNINTNGNASFVVDELLSK